MIIKLSNSLQGLKFCSYSHSAAGQEHQSRSSMKAGKVKASRLVNKHNA